MTSLILTTHIFGASLALLFGAGALGLKKGSSPHKASGRYFVYTMLVMAISAIPLALFVEKTFDVMPALLTCYLVLTSWQTFRPNNTSINLGLFVLGIAIICGFLWIEHHNALAGIERPGVPTGVGYVFSAILAAALVGDIVNHVQGGYSRHHKLIRHLWRMCFALFMATTSFFLSRTHLFPEFFLNAQLHIMFGVAPLILMAFWTLHSLIHRRRPRDPQRLQSEPAC